MNKCTESYWLCLNRGRGTIPCAPWWASLESDGRGSCPRHPSCPHTGVCHVDKLNRAGYSPIMLTALATLKTQDDIETILQLFRLGNVNAKASQVLDCGGPLFT